MKNKYYLSKLMLLNFLCQKILCKHNPFIHEKDSQLKLDTKVFMKAFHVSWNKMPEPPPPPPRFTVDLKHRFAG